MKKGLEEDSTSNQCNAEAILLSGQLGAGHYLGSMMSMQVVHILEISYQHTSS